MLKVNSGNDWSVLFCEVIYGQEPFVRGLTASTQLFMLKENERDVREIK